MADDMFFSQDMRSLRRGQRIAHRTPVFRPCVVWEKEKEAAQYLGVVLDINRYGMRIRMTDPVEQGAVVVVQMMKDEEFKIPLSRPIEATVVRTKEEDDLTDLGLRIVEKKVAKLFPDRPIETPRKLAPGPPGPRMYAVDITMEKHTRRRFGR